MQYLAFITALVLTFVSGHAQEHISSNPLGLTISHKGLRNLVGHSSSGRRFIRSASAVAHRDIAVKSDVLAYSFVAPPDAKIHVRVVPSSLQRSVEIIQIGSFDGHAISQIVFDPFVSRNVVDLLVADSVRIDVTWDVPMKRTSHPLVPPTQRLVNSEWTAPYNSRKHTSLESAQQNVDPKKWYDRFAKYKKVQTSRDGIAYIVASDVLKAGESLSYDKLALFWRGTEQPMFIDDADSNQLFNATDRLYFRGRRAAGDTTWHDVNDSTAIFYLATNASSSQHRRLRPFELGNKWTDTVASVECSERFELDTGYYHPGSGIDDDHSVFESSTVYLEGFYWRNLYGRTKEQASFTTRFTPARTGSVEVIADLATTTKSDKYDPDHVLSFWTGSMPEPEIVSLSGYQAYRHIARFSSDKLPSGCQQIQIQARGTDQLRNTTDWYSEVLVDGFTIRGDALPVLDSGRIHCRIRSSTPSLCQVQNVVGERLYVLDTVGLSFGAVKRSSAGYTIRTGQWARLAAEDRWDGKSYSGSVTVGSKSVFIDSCSSTYIIVSNRTSSDSLQAVISASESQIVAELEKVPQQNVVVILGVGLKLGGTLREFLVSKGVKIAFSDTTHSWTLAYTDTTSQSSQGASYTGYLTTASGTDGHADLALERGEFDVFMADDLGLEHARVSLAKNQGISADTAFGDVIAIAFATHLQEASRWAKHRFQTSGKRVTLYDVDAVFEEYDAGRHSPHAIRAFLQSAFEKSVRKPTHCVLIGNASWDVRNAIRNGNVGANRQDQVPTYGKPSTDMWFGLLDDEYDLATPELLVSRFPVTTPEECKAVVDKIVHADTTEYQQSLRRFLFVGGGTASENFCDMYRRMLDDSFGSEVRFTDPPLCIDTATVCNTDYVNPGLEIRKQMNKGVGWMNYIGHGGTDVFDIKDWDPSDLQNTGKYPILATFSCLTGNYSSPNTLCENAAYLVEPDRGVVSAVGSTGYQYLPVVDLLHYRYHELMLTKGLRTVGDLTYEAKSAFSTMKNQLGRNASLQYCILGDPFTRLRIDIQPNLRIRRDGIAVTDRDGNNAIYVQQDSLFASIVIQNSGIATDVATDVVVRRFIGDDQVAVDSIAFIVPETTCFQYVYRAGFPVLSLGKQRIEVCIDPRRFVNDDTSDNVGSTSYTVLNRSLGVIEPDHHGLMSASRPRFRLLYPFVRKDTSSERIKLTLHNTRESAQLGQGFDYGQELLNDYGSYVDVSLMPSLQQQATIDTSRTYWMRVQSPTSAPVIRPFNFRTGAFSDREHIVLADAMEPIDAQAIYRADSQHVELATRPLAISVQSSGKQTSDPVRIPSMRIAFGDTVLQSSFRNGINVMVLRPFSTKAKFIRRYDTSPNPAPIETGHYGGAKECLAFLRDSVLPHEIVAVAACNESFTQFQRTGLFADFQTLLEMYGSKNARDLTIGSSFAFVGSRDVRFLPVEAYESPVASSIALIDTLIDIRYDRADLNSVRIDKPADLTSISIDHSGVGVEATSQVLSYDGVVSRLTVDSLVYIPSNRLSIERAELLISLIASDLNPSPTLTAASFIYTPAPMTYIDTSMIVQRDVESLLGDSLDLSVSIRNLRTRFTVDSVIGNVYFSNSANNSEVQTITSKPFVIARDDVATIEVRGYATPSWPGINIKALVSSPRVEQVLYPLFQHSDKLLNIGADSSAPEIRVIYNNRQLESGAFVDSLPEFTVLLNDNSAVPISTDDCFTVFVNGIRIRNSGAYPYQFRSTRDCEQLYPGDNIRAALAFTFPMEDGENLLIVRATDASGNKDTAEIYIRLKRERALSVAFFGPNPADNNLTFTVDLSGSAPIQDGLFQLFDMQGREIVARQLKLHVGRSEYEVTLLDESKSSLAPGSYLWRFTILDSDMVPVDNSASGIVTILR